MMVRRPLALGALGAICLIATTIFPDKNFARAADTLATLDDSYLTGDKSTPVFAVFTTGGCQPCRHAVEALETLKQELPQELQKLKRKAGIHGEKKESESDGKDDNDKKDVGVIVAKCDINDAPRLARELGVVGVPTLLLLRDGYTHEYGGSLEPAIVARWIERRTGALYRKVLAAPSAAEAAVEELLEESPSAVVMTVEAPEIADSFLKHSLEALRDIPSFLLIRSAEDKSAASASAAMQAEGVVKVKLTIHKENAEPVQSTFAIPYRALPVSEPPNEAEEKEDRLNEDRLRAEMQQGEILKIQQWVLKHQLPLFGELTLSNLNSYMYDTRPLAWFVGDATAYEAMKKKAKDLYKDNGLSRPFYWLWINPFETKLARAFVDETLQPRKAEPADSLTDTSFIVTDLDGPGRFYFMHEIEVRETDGRATRTHDPLHPGVSADDLRDWLERVIGGKEKRVLASLPVPTEKKTDPHGFELLVTNSIEEWVARNKKEHKAMALIVDFPGCEACQKISDKISSLKKGGKIPKCLALARIDGVANDLDPGWDLFPNEPEMPPVWLFPGRGVGGLGKKEAGEISLSLGKMPRLNVPTEVSDHWLNTHALCQEGTKQEVKPEVKQEVRQEL